MKMQILFMMSLLGILGLVSFGTSLETPSESQARADQDEALEDVPTLSESELRQVEADRARFLEEFPPIESDDYPLLIQPVAFHVIYKSNGVGKTPYAQLVRNLTQLNRAFSGEEARGSKYKKATDARIRFTFHSVDYLENDEYYQLCALANYQPPLKRLLALNPAQYLNVYSCSVSANLGLSWYPYARYRDPYAGGTSVIQPETHWMFGAMVDSRLFSGSTVFHNRWSQGDILTHEVGHSYGVRHLYDAGCSGIPALKDGVADTPYQVGNPSKSCGELKGHDSCPKLPGKDDNANYMGINWDSCRSHFTPGQVQYMRTTINQYKPTLLKQLAPGCVASVDKTDNSPDLRPCRGNVTTSTAPPGFTGPWTKRPWCRTSTTDTNMWAWACCDESCRTGTPTF